jgi:protein TonB
VTDVPRNTPAPLPAAAFNDEEALGASLRAIGVALKNTPTPAPQEQTADYAVDESLLPPARTSGARPDRPRNAPPQLEPPAAGADEEAFFNQLRAIGTVLNSQPIKSSHKPLLARVTDEVPFKRAVEDISSRRAADDLPFKRVTEEASLKPAPKPDPSPIPPAEAVEPHRPAEPIRVTATISADAAVVSPMFRSDLADTEDENAIWKKWMRVAPIGAALVLVIVFLGFRLLSPGKPTLAKQSAEPQPAAVDTEPAKEIPKPSPSTQLSAGRISPWAKSQAVPVGQPAAAVSPAPPVDSQQMNDQLTATPVIPKDVKEKVKEDAPPPDGPIAANAEDVGGSNAIGGVFNDQSRPKVAYVPYPRVTIASSVADGLVVKRTQPVYPPDAFYGGITGKVVLEATVSRTGTVEDVRFVSGPHIFRQAALDAVKTWHYKPYTIDNIAREFQTTVDLAFDQKGGGNPLSLLHVGSHGKKDSKDSKDSASAASKSNGSGVGAP